MRLCSIKNYNLALLNLLIMFYIKVFSFKLIKAVPVSLLFA